MPCLTVPHVPFPDLSLLLPKLPDIPIVIPIPGIPLPCCTLPIPPIPGFPIIIPLGTILALLGPSADGILATIQTVVDTLNALIDQIPPINCPLEEVGLT